MINKKNFRELAAAAVQDEKTKVPEIMVARSVVDIAFYCSQALNEYLGEDRVDQGKELLIFEEFIYFFLHNFARLTNTIEIKKRNSILDEVALWTVYSYVERIWKPLLDDQKDKVVTLMYESLNERELQYSKCKELVSKLPMNISIEKAMVTSDGAINQLCNLLMILVFGKMIMYSDEGAGFFKTIGDCIIDMLAKHNPEWRDLITRT
jgi:hypothetical protein